MQISSYLEIIDLLYLNIIYLFIVNNSFKIYFKLKSKNIVMLFIILYIIR